MGLQIIATVVAGLLLVVAAIGTIIPVLPGSLLALLTLLGWAWTLDGTPSWVMGAIAMALVLIGWSASLVLTGRKLKERKVPGRSVLVGGVFAVVGMFVIPIVGFVLGFALGLFLSELQRRANAAEAWSASIAALKATGIGILIEFCCACLAGSMWAIGVIWYFVAA